MATNARTICMLFPPSHTTVIVTVLIFMMFHVVGVVVVVVVVAQVNDVCALTSNYPNLD